MDAFVWSGRDNRIVEMMPVRGTPSNSPVHIIGTALAHLTQHSLSDPTRECCGLLAGHNGVIAHVFPAENVAANRATEYEIAPQEIFERMREMRAGGLELLGIYHSHPSGQNEPSPRDIESAYYPDAAYFIISPLPDAPRPVRAFSICDGRVNELQIEILAAE